MLSQICQKLQKKTSNIERLFQNRVLFGDFFFEKLTFKHETKQVEKKKMNEISS